MFLLLNFQVVNLEIFNLFCPLQIQWNDKIKEHGISRVYCTYERVDIPTALVGS